MGRTRNWPLETTLEVLVRHSIFKQTYATIAKAMPRLSYQQVRNFLMEGHVLHPSPPNQWQADMQQVITDRVAAEEKAAISATPARPSGELSPERQAELDAEIAGCIDLVKQAAAQFGLTPGKFLWLCTTRLARTV